MAVVLWKTIPGGFSFSMGKIANRYKNESQIMGYDLVNELDGRDLATRLMS